MYNLFLLPISTPNFWRTPNLSSQHPLDDLLRYYDLSALPNWCHTVPITVPNSTYHLTLLVCMPLSLTIYIYHIGCSAKNIVQVELSWDEWHGSLSAYSQEVSSIKNITGWKPQHSVPGPVCHKIIIQPWTNLGLDIWLLIIWSLPCMCIYTIRKESK